MQRISEELQTRILELRKVGNSIPEIVRQTGVAKTTVTRYVSGVTIPDEYLRQLKEKQGGAKDRAKDMRENILSDVEQRLGTISERDRLFLLIGLYWGEGTKKDFEIINSDPFLIQAILCSLQYLNIDKNRITLSLRLHRGISIPEAKAYWSRTTGIDESRINRIEIIEGKKKGKLKHGMCRIRVQSGIRERLFIQTAISLIGKDCNERVLSTLRPRSSMDRTEVS